MTSAEIINVVVTVAVVQLVCDLLANHFIFGKERYQRLLGRLSREQFKLVKEEAKEHVNEKQEKKLQKAKDDFAEASAEVARVHMSPKFFTSIAFVILYRILVTEYYGRSVAIVPFTPWKLVRKLSMRGIELKAGEAFEATAGMKDVNQACSFLFIYILSTLSIKHYVNQAFGTKPPKGADGGLMSMMDAPQSQRILKNFGMDNESFKLD